MQRQSQTWIVPCVLQESLLMMLHSLLMMRLDHLHSLLMIRLDHSPYLLCAHTSQDDRGLASRHAGIL